MDATPFVQAARLAETHALRGYDAVHFVGALAVDAAVFATYDTPPSRPPTVAASARWQCADTGRSLVLECGTIVAMTTEALRTVRDHFSEYVDRVERDHERIVVTRNGRRAAVLISADDFDSMEETLALLSDPAEMAAIRQGQAEVARGDVVSGVDAVRDLLRARRG